MIVLLFTLVSTFSWGTSMPNHWSSLVRIVEKHEFYRSNEAIDKPKDSWQTLFAVIFRDVNFNMHKDCVFYRVPGEEAGILKFKRTDLNKDCDIYLLREGDSQIEGLRAMQFFIEKETIGFHYSFTDYRSGEWSTTVLNKVSKKALAPQVSSADFRSSGLIFLAPQSSATTEDIKPLASKEVCHKILDDCTEASPSICDQCEDGWYEVPNGCSIGPKFCGQLDCGRKNAPACRRGIRYQRERKNFDCRVDSSFAYCSEGLEIQCVGNQAWCR